MRNFQTKPFELGFEITRADTETRIVEGYCFVNELGAGINLKRAAMEEATPDYMKWGAVREMHRADSAVGNASGVHPTTGEQLGITWDEKGAYFRAHIVDDKAWEKVDTKVYKGFSVGVQPLVVRGNTISKCIFGEVSLVDRPVDKDCPFVKVGRAEAADITVQWFEDGTNEVPAELQAEVEAERVERASAFKEIMDKREPKVLRSAAIDILQSLLWDANYMDKPEDRTKAFSDATKQFLAYALPLCNRGELEFTEPVAPEAPTPLEITRADEGFTVAAVPTDEFVVVRSETLKGLVDDYVARAEEIRSLKAMPTYVAPMRFTDHLDRKSLDKYFDDQPEVKRAEEFLKEYKELSSKVPTDLTEDERHQRVIRMQVLKANLKTLGVEDI